ncbi:zeta toxin family protein [Agrobacterium tumefaciens]|uniref:zeta toxin family protein n=1 Tax=Agrobacterium tumefaciens TaxID=358 RepID=UPI0015718C8C|nr:zeta toxin family protein [Agrobacterium tumefaciens]NTA19676.1 hypothetical protein [Agrobacterium tumefaciens]WCK75007.1 zeta toxin family protein [Agrobacterium tumefaciens]
MRDDLGVDRALTLSLQAKRDIFETQIIPAIGARGPSVAKPTFTVVCGQQGAGKSTLVRQIKSRTGGESTQRIIADDLNAYIPGNNAALLQGSHALERANSSAATEWYHQLFDRSITNRYNIILESCYPPNHYASLLDKARSNGYRTELNIIATDRITSFTAIHDRFERALANSFIASTVLPDVETHDHYYSIWPRVVLEVENYKTFDRIAIVRRDGETCYDNEQALASDGESTWGREPGALRALMDHRNRPLDERQQHWVNSVWERLRQSVAFAQHPDSARLPIASYQSAIATRLREHSDLSSFEIRPEYMREFSNKFSWNLKRDISFVVNRKSKGGEFREDAFEELFCERITAVHHSLQEAITAQFESAIGKWNDEGDVRSRDVSTFYARTSGESSTARRLNISTNPRGMVPSADVVNISEQQAQSVKHRRPKFLVEVSKNVYRPIEQYNRMVFDRVRFPNITRDRRKLNVLIRMEDGTGYETPSSLKKRLGSEQHNIFTKTMNEGQLPHSLASTKTSELPIVLVDAGNGATFIAGEKFSLSDNGRRIPTTISADRILVRNENGTFSELCQRLAGNTELLLPPEAIVQLGLQRQQAVNRARAREASELEQRTREHSSGRV